MCSAVKKLKKKKLLFVSLFCSRASSCLLHLSREGEGEGECEGDGGGEGEGGHGSISELMAGVTRWTKAARDADAGRLSLCSLDCSASSEFPSSAEAFHMTACTYPSSACKHPPHPPRTPPPD